MKYTHKETAFSTNQQWKIDIFIYPPHKLNGFEAGHTYVILAAVINEKYKNLTVHWYKDNTRFISGKNLMAIKVGESGQYTCGVEIDYENKVIYPAVNVTIITDTSISPDSASQLPAAATVDNVEETSMCSQQTLSNVSIKETAATVDNVEETSMCSQETLSNVSIKETAATVDDVEETSMCSQETLSNVSIKETAATVDNVEETSMCSQETLSKVAIKETAATVDNVEETSMCSQETLSKVSIKDITFKEEIGHLIVKSQKYNKT